MTIITTISDLINIVDGWTGDNYWTEEPADHSSATETIAYEISGRAHAEGLRYGQDWDEFLNDISIEDCEKILS